MGITYKGEAPVALPLEGATLAPITTAGRRRALASVEGEAPVALPLEGATLAPLIAVRYLQEVS